MRRRPFVGVVDNRYRQGVGLPLDRFCASLLAQIEEQPDQVLGIGLQNLCNLPLDLALTQSLLELVGKGRSAVSCSKPLLQNPLGVNRQREAVIFDCALGEVGFRYAVAVTVPKLKNQGRSVDALVGEVESSRILGVGEL